MKISTVIERRTIRENLFWFSSTSFQEGDKWFNCLYINFFKEDYPNLKYPALVEGWRPGTLRFNYSFSDVAELDWHCGITFYQETTFPENPGRTLVKAGCDFQHLYDDNWMTADHGEQILKRYVPGLQKQFIELIESNNQAARP